jgi:hypothetical protein
MTNEETDKCSQVSKRTEATRRKIVKPCHLRLDVGLKADVNNICYPNCVRILVLINTINAEILHIKRFRRGGEVS